MIPTQAFASSTHHADMQCHTSFIPGLGSSLHCWSTLHYTHISHILYSLHLLEFSRHYSWSVLDKWALFPSQLEIPDPYSFYPGDLLLLAGLIPNFGATHYKLQFQLMDLQSREAIVFLVPPLPLPFFGTSWLWGRLPVFIKLH